MNRIIGILSSIAVVLSFAVATATPAAAVSLADTWADFDGDGHSDVVVGAPGPYGGSGAVTVIPGSASGLDASAAVQWKRSTAGAGADSSFDRFGAAVATGDFDADGFSDLAIGAPGAGVAVGGVTKGSAGIVVVLRGSASGLTATGSQVWSQESSGIHGIAARWDVFGESLATGDLNGDGFFDLAVGSPGNSHRSSDGTLHRQSGQINVIYGSASGLTAAGSRRYLQATPGVPGATRAYDRFGSDLAAGDRDGDGHDDLAIGTPTDGSYDVGTVSLLNGSPTGLTVEGAFLLSQNSPGVPGTSESGDHFGDALAFGDLDADTFADLVVGIPGEHYTSRTYQSGQVQVFYGHATDLITARVQSWDQASEDVPGSPEPYDAFGGSLAAGDYNDDGVGDLAIGVPGEGIGEVDGAGAAVVLWGAATTGLTATSSAIFRQGRSGVGDTLRHYEHFSAALTAGDFDGDGDADLGIGTPFEIVASTNGAGAVHVLSGGTTGLGTPTFFEAGTASLPLGYYGTVGAALAG